MNVGRLLVAAALLGMCGSAAVDATARAADVKARVDAEVAHAVAPAAHARLFNGKDLAGWIPWLKASGHDDPQHVFTVEDGMIHMKGGQHRGYLATEKSYKDYHLSVEYKWGKTTDGGKYVRNSGVLIHAVGPFGGAGAWMTCLEVQLAQGCEADLIVIRGKDDAGEAIPFTITCQTRLAKDKRTRWQPGGTKVKYSGKQFWWKDHTPFFKEFLDTRGDKDVASPYGQWTKVECICRGDKVTVKVNGVTVNEAIDVWPAAGRILLQDEGHEIWFRNVEIKPLAKAGK